MSQPPQSPPRSRPPLSSPGLSEPLHADSFQLDDPHTHDTRFLARNGRDADGRVTSSRRTRRLLVMQVGFEACGRDRRGYVAPIAPGVQPVAALAAPDYPIFRISRSIALTCTPGAR